MEQKQLLPEDEGYRLLAEFGIPVPDYEVVRDVREAIAAAARIGYPVVLKVISPAIIHKSEVGGVKTGIDSHERLSEAFSGIFESVRYHNPEAPVTGIIVEKELPPGLELFIGGKIDPAFGRVISCGLGGTTIELFHDFSLRILPVSRDELSGMIRDLRSYPLISGYRGKPPLDEGQMIQCLESAVRMFESGQITEFDINPLILYEHGSCAVDARIYRGKADSCIPQVKQAFDPDLLHPKSIAVIGASADPKKIGYAILRNLLPFPGTLYPVNPNQNEVLGRRAYRCIADIPGEVDTAVIAVPSALVPGVMEDLALHGTRLAIIISSGFREMGKEGRDREEKILDIALKAGIRIVGPNCLGIVLPHLQINTTFDPTTPRKGNIGFISQSGAVITTIVDWSVPEEIGFSSVFSVGNQVDLGFIDFVRFAAAEPETKAIILYIEEIKDGCSFLDVLKEITETIPVITLKSGSSSHGKKAAASHTGSLAGDYEVYQAAFRQAGAIPVFSLREAFDVAELLVSEGYPPGNRAIVVTTAGGFGVLASDYSERFGVTLPPLSPAILEELDGFLPQLWNRDNPLDIIGDGGADRFARVFDTLIKFQEEWDIAVIIAVPSAVLDPTQLALEISRFSGHTRNVIVGCMIGGESMKGGLSVLRHNQIPNFDDIENAFKAIGRSLVAVKNQVKNPGHDT
ncbi:MAG: acetate--CoA ligase family protein [Methanoregulaceae archaeon]|jgi:acetyl coenzyme A synthetase (ADP forming)-like protein|nr:acetate--CoA ligase family protein [Methanoregulaceae archaeon]MCU0628482.1 acetate--CoA ligase family protein [Methanoregulaceae archaeon]